MLNLLRQNIRNLVPYSTARDDYQGPKPDAYLDANENPFDTDFNRYPDPRQRSLKALIAERKGVSSSQIFIGNGSDEAIDLMYRLFCEPGQDNAIAIAPTYGMYQVAAEINDVEYRKVPLVCKDGSPFQLDVQALLATADEHSKLMWICSPNNPTGNAFPAADIEQLLQGFHGIVVLDEAYADFSSSSSWLTRLDEFPNLVILQTFSKAWGLAGLRCGLAFASRDICSYMDRVKYPYNINTITQSLVLQQLTEMADACFSHLQTLLSERQRLADELPYCSCVKKIYPSDANFLLVEVDDPKLRYQQLLAHGIIVRDRSSVCPGCLRITIGTPEQNNSVIATLK